MRGTVVRNIPNTEVGAGVMAALRVSGCVHRRRGRGHRFGHNTGGYAQSLPARLAERFSFYITDPNNREGYQYMDYVGFTSTGKIRLRVEA